MKNSVSTPARGGRGAFLGLALALAALPQLRAGNVDVLTQHNDLSRTGANLQETTLTPSNVNSTQFGKLFTRSLDGAIFAQPLYVQGLTIASQTHNVVFVCTENNSVYAFDADNASASTPLWQVNLGTAVPYSDVNSCTDLMPEIGITGTPVIDTNTDTLYVDAKSTSGGNYFHQLHALDITTGAEKFGGPVTVAATVGSETFNAQHQHQRPGLLLLSNVVYLAFGSHCDWETYEGWLIGYNATNLSRTSVFVTTPNGSEGAIWSCGMAPSADTNGNIYVMTGNGTFDANLGGSDYGQSFIKFSTTNGFGVADWFAPWNATNLNGPDKDIGSGGPVLLPGTHLMAGLDKEGTFYLVDQNNLGHQSQNFASDTNIVQEFSATPAADCMGQCPVYWNGPGNQQYLYLSCGKGKTTAFSFNGSTVNTTPLSSGAFTMGDRPGGLSLSANGATNGILWAIDSGSTIRAYNATNLNTELWDSGQNSARDALGTFVKFASPTIVNGKVYVATSNSTLVVYGLLGPPPAFTVSVSPSAELAGTQGTNLTFTVTVTGTNGFNSAVTLGISGLPANTTTNFNPPSVTGSGSSTLTVTTTSSTPSGAYTLTIFGVGAGQTNSTTVTLVVGTSAFPGLLVWTDGSGSDTNWSNPLNWTNPASGGFGPPGFANSILFTNTAATGSSGTTNNVLDESFGVQSLQYANNAANTSPNYHVTYVSPGDVLTITNGIIVGTATDAGAAQVVNAVVTGAGGSLVLSNGVLAVTQGSGTDGAHQAVLDLSGLGALQLTNVSRICVAVYETPPQVANGGQRSSGVLYLAQSNVIAVTSTGVTNGILVGWNDSQGNGNSLGVQTASDKGSALYLGETNTIFTDAIYVGTDKSLGCLLAFNPNGLNNPVAYFRGTGGAASRVSLWGIGDTSMKNNSNQSASGTNDFSGGTVNALVNNMTVGVSETGASSSDTGDGTGTLTFSAGVIDANNLTNGWSVGTGTNGTDLGTGTVNVNGTATLKVNNTLALAVNGSTGTGVPTGRLAAQGGTILANKIVAGIGISTLALNGASLSVTNTAGNPPAGLSACNLTNSTLHFDLNGAAISTNVVATNLAASGLNTIVIDSAVNVSAPVTFPLISYGSFSGSFTANFARGSLPAGFSASLVNNPAQHRIDLTMAARANVTPRIGNVALAGGNFLFTGSNGLPQGTYWVLASTNVTLPVNQWTPVSTNQFDALGNFGFTNPPATNTAQLFYLIELP
jgi:hypothetical protein